jgi:hypothetical protein
MQFQVHPRRHAVRVMMMAVVNMQQHPSQITNAIPSGQQISAPLPAVFSMPAIRISPASPRNPDSRLAPRLEPGDQIVPVR